MVDFLDRKTMQARVGEVVSNSKSRGFDFSLTTNEPFSSIVCRQTLSYAYSESLC